MSRNPKRQELAREFGATEILAERGDAAVSAVLQLTEGVGVDSALECVGTGESLQTAMGIARPGSVVGVVGAPHHMDFPIMDIMLVSSLLRIGRRSERNDYLQSILKLS